MPDPVRISAFTIKAKDGRLRVIKTKSRIRQATSLCKIHNLPQPDAEVDAIWDTGATNTAVSSHLAKSLGLKPITKTTVVGVGSKDVSDVYLIDILLPNGVVAPEIKVTEATKIQDTEVLIGMDIITAGDFSITNCGGITCCSFRTPPDSKHIDYIETVETLKAGAQKIEYTRQQFKNLSRTKRKHKKH